MWLLLATLAAARGNLGQPELLRTKRALSGGVEELAKRCQFVADTGSTKTELSLSCVEDGQVNIIGECPKVHDTAMDSMLDASDFSKKLSSLLKACEADLCASNGTLRGEFLKLSYTDESFSRCQEFVQQTPTHFIATAGMRLWANNHDITSTSSLEAKIKSALKEGYGKPQGTTSFMISSGLLEAYMGFMTSVDQQEGMSEKSDFKNIAYLEIGGSSAQVAFACPAGAGFHPSAASLLESKGVVATTVLQDPQDGNLEVFGKSMLGGGINRVLRSVVYQAAEDCAANGQEVCATPCLQEGVTVHLDQMDKCVTMEKEGKYMNESGVYTSGEVRIGNPFCRHAFSANPTIKKVSGQVNTEDRYGKCQTKVKAVLEGNNELRIPLPFRDEAKLIQNSFSRCNHDSYEKTVLVISTSPLVHSSLVSKRSAASDFQSELGGLGEKPLKSPDQLATLVAAALVGTYVNEFHIGLDAVVGNGAEWSTPAAKLHMMLQKPESFFHRLTYHVNSEREPMDPEDLVNVTAR
mmetsp:Transcript_17113/g.34646  ORF Transcript_17113/g.34646 Transcript_17113/m.34646 type:complete len:523 (+) Transcript_17113:52-1620(+)